MADIQLASTSDVVKLQFVFNTPQQFFYTVEVLDSQSMQLFHDTGSWNGKTAFNLGTSNNLVGKYLCITWTIIDPLGSGQSLDAAATIFQNTSACINSQKCTGSSSDTHSTVYTVGQFINQP